MKLPSGKILYRVADVLAAETAGTRGFTWGRMGTALEAYPNLKRGEAEKLLAYLKKALKE